MSAPLSEKHIVGGVGPCPGWLRPTCSCARYGPHHAGPHLESHPHTYPHVGLHAGTGTHNTSNWHGRRVLIKHARDVPSLPQRGGRLLGEDSARGTFTRRLAFPSARNIPHSCACRGLARNVAPAAPSVFSARNTHRILSSTGHERVLQTTLSLLVRCHAPRLGDYPHLEDTSCQKTAPSLYGGTLQYSFGC